MKDSQVPVRAPGVLEALVDGDRVLMSPERFEYFGLTDTGPLVWDLIDGQRSLEEILASIRLDFDGNSEEMAHDLHDFVSGLEAAGLVVLKDQDPPSPR